MPSYNESVSCKGCGAILVKESCIYCGTDNDVVFMSIKEYQEKLHSHLFFWGNPALGLPDTYCGRKIILRCE